MTEAEWFAATDPTPMLDFLRGKASERKCVLLICSYLRCWRVVPSDTLYWDEMDQVELQASAWQALREATQVIKERLVMNQDFETAGAILDIERAMDRGRTGCDKVIQVARRVLPVGRRQVAQAIVDIFGPLAFRPLSIDPDWRTSTVLALARGIYDDRAFDRLPILADALQDAGCENPDILTHLRGGGEHCRGCWPLDLVLGKE